MYKLAHRVVFALILLVSAGWMVVLGIVIAEAVLQRRPSSPHVTVPVRERQAVDTLQIEPSRQATAVPTLALAYLTPVHPLTSTPATALTPVPTSTPAPATPTPAPLMPTSTFTIVAEDTFDTPTSGWPIRDEATWRSGYADGRYHLTLDGKSTVGVSTPFPEGDYRLSVDVMLGPQGDAGVLVIFGEPATFYQIALRSNGTYAIQRVEHDTVTDVLGWREHAAFQRGTDVANRLRVERQGSTLRFFANDQFITDFVVPEGVFTSRYGFTLTSATGYGSASFDNLRGEALSMP